jgi:hypothetical protein
MRPLVRVRVAVKSVDDSEFIVDMVKIFFDIISTVHFYCM